MLSDYTPLAALDGNPAWRPTPMTPELRARLDYDDAAEDQGMDAVDRKTCYTHQCWWGDCITDPSHANPVTKFNWCDGHFQPVQVCGCRRARAGG